MVHVKATCIIPRAALLVAVLLYRQHLSECHRGRLVLFIECAAWLLPQHTGALQVVFVAEVSGVRDLLAGSTQGKLKASWELP